MADKTEIRIPNLGDIEEVEILEILVKAGDKVSKEDPLVSLETDKAVMEVPSPEDGEIESLSVSPGDKISEGDLIGYLIPSESAGGDTPKEEEKTAEKDSEPEKKTEAPAKSAPASQPSVSKTPAPQKAAEPTPSKPGGKYHASPSVRKFARELGADLTQVEGTAPKGRITKEDVQKWIKSRLQNPASAGGAGIGSLPSVKIEDFEKYGEVENYSLSRVKKITGTRLQASWQNIPLVTHFEEADITELESFRKDLNQQLQKEGIKVTPLAFVVKAVVKALKEFPHFNSSLSDDGSSLYLKKYYNIGFAADTPDGLLVPVIHDAGNMGVKEIASTLIDLSSRAREKKLDSKNLTGASFTISSLGGIGGTNFTPVINPPEAAIMGVSRNKWQPEWNGEEFEPRLMLPFSLSYDHRIIDGAEAARFCRYVSEILTDFRLSAL